MCQALCYILRTYSMFNSIFNFLDQSCHALSDPKCKKYVKFALYDQKQSQDSILCRSAQRKSPIPNSLGSSPEFTTVSVIKEAATLCVSIFPEQNETFEWDDLEHFI